MFYASWPALAGFICQYIVFHFWLRFSRGRAALAALVLNTALCALLSCEVELQQYVSQLRQYTGGQCEWWAFWAVALIFNAGVELWLLTSLFRAKRSWALFGLLFLAQLISVAAIFMCFVVHGAF
jgi:hypothetical protein